MMNWNQEPGDKNQEDKGNFKRQKFTCMPASCEPETGERFWVFMTDWLNVKVVILLYG